MTNETWFMHPYRKGTKWPTLWYFVSAVILYWVGNRLLLSNHLVYPDVLIIFLTPLSFMFCTLSLHFVGKVYFKPVIVKYLNPGFLHTRKYMKHSENIYVLSKDFSVTKNMLLIDIFLRFMHYNLHHDMFVLQHACMVRAWYSLYSTQKICIILCLRHTCNILIWYTRVERVVLAPGFSNYHTRPANHSSTTAIICQICALKWWFLGLTGVTTNWDLHHVYFIQHITSVYF